LRNKIVIFENIRCGYTFVDGFTYGWRKANVYLSKTITFTRTNALQDFSLKICFNIYFQIKNYFEWGHACTHSKIIKTLMPLLLELKIREWAKYSQMSTVFVSFLKRDRGLPDFKRAHKNYFSWAFLFFWPLLTLFAGAIMDATVTLVNKKKHFLFVKKFKLDWNIMLINHYSFTSRISFGLNIFIGVFFLHRHFKKDFNNAF